MIPLYQFTQYKLSLSLTCYLHLKHMIFILPMSYLSKLINIYLGCSFGFNANASRLLERNKNSCASLPCSTIWKVFQKVVFKRKCLTNLFWEKISLEEQSLKHLLAIFSVSTGKVFSAKNHKAEGLCVYSGQRPLTKSGPDHLQAWRALGVQGPKYPADA